LSGFLIFVVEAYYEICRLTDAEPNGDTYMSSRLKALDAQQIIQANFRKGHGNTKFIEVASDVELIIDNLFPQDFNNMIANNYGDIESIIVNELKKGSNGATC